MKHEGKTVGNKKKPQLGGNKTRNPSTQKNRQHLVIMLTEKPAERTAFKKVISLEKCWGKFMILLRGRSTPPKILDTRASIRS